MVFKFLHYVVRVDHEGASLWKESIWWSMKGVQGVVRGLEISVFNSPQVAQPQQFQITSSLTYVANDFHVNQL